MFHHQSKFTLLISLILLSGCGQEIEERLAPDPQLQEQRNNSSSATSQESSDQAPANNSSQESSDQTPANNSSPTTSEESSDQETSSVSQRRENIPETIPFYPNAEVVSRDINSENIGTIELTATDEMDTIVSFYEGKLQENPWDIVTPFSGNATTDRRIVMAESSSLQLKVTIFEAAASGEANQIVLAYQPLSESNQQPTTPRENTATLNSTETFTDLEKTPDPLEGYVRDVAKLGILSPIEPNSQTFAPNEEITRRTFARWLFRANNRFYRDRPSQQIREVSQAETPAFQDVSPSDPDFEIIQGLAEAGMIPSRLTGDATMTQFRPDAPLQRETLLLWKVPLDTRSGLPTAQVKTVQETWGFQDAGKTDPKALGAIVADFAKGEQSNIRRLYGYTQLLQPNKPVTRAEAAAALWSFGTQGDTLTAKELANDN